MTAERTDHELIAAANRGDAAAMEQLYRRHRHWALAVARRYCSRAADAEDVLQEVFKYFFAKFPGFTLTCQLRTFLFPVIRNRSLDLHRKQARYTELPDEHATTRPASGVDERQSRRALADLVADLPPDQRDVVILRFLDGCKVAEIAQRLGIPAGTVKSRLHHALKALRRQHR